MPLPVARAAKGAADRMIDKNGAGRANAGHNIEYGADNEGWNSLVLDDMGDETDGLVAKGSVGDQERQINARSYQLLCDSRRQLVFNLAVTPKAAHERNVHRRETASDAATGQ